MAVEFFFAPMVGAGTRQDTYRAKYQGDPAREAAGHIRYSHHTTAALMLSAPQAFLDNTVKVDPEMFFLCAEADLTDNIGGAQSVAIKAFLEPLGIPTNWVSAANSYREVLRGIIGQFMFSQRHEGLNGSGFFEDLEAAGFGLNTQWQNLSPAFRDTMQATIDDFEWPMAPAATDQVRKVLKDFSDKWTGREFFIAGVEI